MWPRLAYVNSRRNDRRLYWLPDRSARSRGQSVVMVKSTKNSNGLDGGTSGELLGRCWNGDSLTNALMRPHPVEIHFAIGL